MRFHCSVAVLGMSQSVAKLTTKIIIANDLIMIFCEEDFPIIPLIWILMRIIRIGKHHVKITVK